LMPFWYWAAIGAVLGVIEVAIPAMVCIWLATAALGVAAIAWRYPGLAWEHQAPRVGEAVARGEAEIGLQPISELIEVEDIDVVGPLPAELQSPDLVYVAGAPYVSEQPIAAKALIDFLADPKAAAVYKAKGLQPG
jgi:hypothetical protein